MSSFSGQRQQFVLQRQQRKLATVAGSELEHGQSGRCASESLHVQKRLDLVVAKDRPVLADKRRAKLAVAAQADGALHVALERHPNLVLAQSACQRAAHGVAHHDLRPAQQAGWNWRATVAAADPKQRHDADVARPARQRAIDRGLHVQARRRTNRRYSRAIQQRVGRSRAVQQRARGRTVCVSASIAIHDGRSGAQADAAGHEDDVGTRALVQRPTGAVRAAQAQGDRPLPSAASVRVTLPATRIVWSQVPARSEPALTLIAISPTPGRYSMLNWPGETDSRACSAASRKRK